jgi:hypothetical protein
MFERGFEMRMNLIADPNLVEPTGWALPKYFRRTLRERLFSRMLVVDSHWRTVRKWQPFRTHKVALIREYEPSPYFYKVGQTIMAHPVTLAALKAQIERPVLVFTEKEIGTTP